MLLGGVGVEVAEASSNTAAVTALDMPSMRYRILLCKQCFLKKALEAVLLRVYLVPAVTM